MNYRMENYLFTLFSMSFQISYIMKINEELYVFLYFVFLIDLALEDNV